MAGEMNHESPLISIIIPVYNGEKYIIRALSSAASQSYSLFEIWVVDDGSTDRTGKLVEEFIAGHPDILIRYLRQSNQGVSAARNAGIRNSRGAYLSLLDSDDALLPDCLQILESYRKSYPAAACIMGGANCLEFDRSGKEVARYNLTRPKLEYINSREAYRRLFYQTILGVNAIIIQRAAYDRVGGFSEEFSCSEDLDFWFRLARHYPFLIIPETVGVIYKYPQGLSQNPDLLFRFMKKTFSQERERLLEIDPEGGPALYRKALVLAHLASIGYYRKHLPVALLPFLRHLLALLFLHPPVVFNGRIRKKLLYERNPSGDYTPVRKVDETKY